MIRKLLCLNLFCLLVLTATSFSQERSSDGIWKGTAKSGLRNSDLAKIGNPLAFEAFRLNSEVLDRFLITAPNEFMTIGRKSGSILSLPMPDGSYTRFRIKNSPIMAPKLAAKFPMIRTFNGQGIDDPTATTRFDVSPNGFRAIILFSGGTIYVEPVSAGNTETYVSFDKQNAQRTENTACLLGSGKSRFTDILSEYPGFVSVPRLGGNGAELRTHRLAVAATGEYTAFHGGTVEGAMAAIVTTMNRVNGIYEREVAVRMELVANNDLVIYTDGSTDPYTNNSGGSMLGQNQTNLDAVIGTANYDIGHVFSTGGGGIASLNSPCSASRKARGVTGLSNPSGEVFNVDFVAHEMGHQYGGDHTFNGTSSSCGGGNRSGSAAYEPGSGSTIQAYAGICSPQNLQRSSNDYFHTKSLEEIVTFINGSGNCGTATPTGNTPPTVTVNLGVVQHDIPKQTPFELAAVGNDVDGDTVTYNWEEFDLGSSSLPDDDVDGNPRPIFRSYEAVTSPIRTFPSLPYILDNANVPPMNYGCGGRTCITGEILPAITRSMTFRATVRDNRAGGGGIDTAAVQVLVDGNSGPFAVIAPDTAVTWAGNSFQTVTWDTANTDSAPVSAANVRIMLSTDGGLTFPTVISASTPNDGAQQIRVPNVETTQGRIKIQGVDKIFFDINGADLTINQSAAPVGTRFDFDGDNKADISVFRRSLGEFWYLRSSDGLDGAFAFGSPTDIPVPGDFTGDGIADFSFWRPSTGEWFILRSDNTGFFSGQFGATGDIPAPGDFDGDGTDDLAVFRPSTGTWFIQRSSDNQTDFVQFGAPTDLPLVGDYDNDGKDDVAIYKPDVSQFWQIRSTQGLAAFAFGAPGDTAMTADFSGDGTDDMVLFRPATGFWFVLRSEDSNFFGFPFGTSGDIPAPGDYDGDGTADPTVFRPSSTTWFSQQSTNGATFTPFGIATDEPLPATYNAP